MSTRKRNLSLWSPGVRSNIKISLVLVLWRNWKKVSVQGFFS